jgi:nickel/cobalt transporter (NicO) family protein
MGAISRSTIRLLCACALVVMALAVVASLLPAPASAHPLGNFTVNRYSRVEFSADLVRVVYVLDFAEIPTLLEMPFIDTDEDGEVSDAEMEAYLDRTLDKVIDNVRLVVGDERLTLDVAERSGVMIPGLAGMPTLRIDAVFTTHLPDGWKERGSGGYIDRNYLDRLGWRELVIVGGPGVEVTASSAASEDLSRELREYPDWAASMPLLVSEATFTLVPGEGHSAGGVSGVPEAAGAVTERAEPGGLTGRVGALVAARQLTPGVLALGLLLAMAWGAVHALSPGHGKAVVAAYLVGARGTPKHAMFLGLTVTLTHTAGVFALGGVTIYLSRYILPEDLYPWLSVMSGLLVITIGAALVYSRIRGGQDHSHEHGSPSAPLTHSHGGRTHTHLPPGANGTPVTWRALLALGVSGGLVPCPSALVLLLGAISLGRLELGMLLVAAFSVGLAAVLTAIGLLLVYARRAFERYSFTPRVPRLLPIASAAAISLAGIVIVVTSLRDTGIV